eukprot:Filipodium_phascolosomae@DN88_c0_g1_i1.p1
MQSNADKTQRRLKTSKNSQCNKTPTTSNNASLSLATTAQGLTETRNNYPTLSTTPIVDVNKYVPTTKSISQKPSSLTNTATSSRSSTCESTTKQEENSVVLNQSLICPAGPSKRQYLRLHNVRECQTISSELTARPHRNFPKIPLDLNPFNNDSFGWNDRDSTPPRY